jgi:hypothetical protein
MVLLKRYSSPMEDIVERLIALNHPDACDAADEIERLRSLLKEVIPYLLHDVACALDMGPIPEGHEDDCEDCTWYRKATEWQKRIDNGELDL